MGSCTVCHASKTRNEYETGEVLHIYCPREFDSAGNETWLDLNITRTVLKVEMPQEFLDNTVYSIIIDLSFGYTTIGGTESTGADFIRGSWFACPGSGKANSISELLSVYIEVIEEYRRIAINSDFRN